MRFTRTALEDLSRITEQLREHKPLRQGARVLAQLPFVGRPAQGFAELDATLRELILPAGESGYVLLYRVGPGQLVSVLAARHQREEHYH